LGRFHCVRVPLALIYRPCGRLATARDAGAGRHRRDRRRRVPAATPVNPRAADAPMSARAIASTTISFGLVSVPVKLYSSAESSTAVSFNWLHKKCGSRLKQQYVCSQDGEKVEREDMVKGYEFSKGQYNRKSTRLNSSHVKISYAVFCLKKKKT